MEDTQLRDSLLKLREEIARLDPQDDAKRARLRSLISGIERRLSHPTDAAHHDSLVDDVREAVEQFEVGRPRTTAILNQIMVTLSNMGI